MFSKFLTVFLLTLIGVLKGFGIGSGSPQQCDAPGGCYCGCNCPPPAPIYTDCPICPTNGTGNQIQCETAIKAVGGLFGSQPLALLGLTINYLLANLSSILEVLLNGNNTLMDAVLPLANILCTLVGLILLILASLGLLGPLGFNGLLDLSGIGL